MFEKNREGFKYDADIFKLQINNYEESLSNRSRSENKSNEDPLSSPRNPHLKSEENQNKSEINTPLALPAKGRGRLSNYHHIKNLKDNYTKKIVYLASMFDNMEVINTENFDEVN
jgi:hypothetical protein